MSRSFPPFTRLIVLHFLFYTAASACAWVNPTDKLITLPFLLCFGGAKACNTNHKIPVARSKTVAKSKPYSLFRIKKKAPATGPKFILGDC